MSIIKQGLIVDLIWRPSTLLNYFTIQFGITINYELIVRKLVVFRTACLSKWRCLDFFCIFDRQHHCSLVLVDRKHPSANSCTFAPVSFVTETFSFHTFIVRLSLNKFHFIVVLLPLSKRSMITSSNQNLVNKI